VRDVLIRNLPDHIVEKLKTTAASHGRSLQQELYMMAMQKAQYASVSDIDPVEAARCIKRRLRAKYGELPDSTPLIREAREQR